MTVRDSVRQDSVQHDLDPPNSVPPGQAREPGPALAQRVWARPV